MIVKRTLGLILIVLLWVSATIYAKKPLAVVYSEKTANATVNYPTYKGDFDFFTRWLSKFAEFDVITDADVEAGALKDYKAVLLPDNAVMSEEEAEYYLDFMDRGGRVFGCNSTSVRNEELQLAKYLLADVFGVTWVQWVNDPSKQNYVVFTDHPIFEGLDVDHVQLLTSATQVVNNQDGEAIATWVNADLTTPSEPEERNAAFFEYEGNIFVTFQIIKSIYLNHKVYDQIMQNIVAYLAPDAIK